MLSVFLHTNLRKKCSTIQPLRIALLFLCLSGTAFNKLAALTTNRTDSLTFLLQHSHIDSVKAALQFQLGFEYLYTEPATTVGYCNNAISLYKLPSELKEFGRTYNLMGSAYFSMGEYQMALNCFKEANIAATKAHDSLYMAKSLNNMGGIMHKNGKLDNSVDYYMQALHLYELMGNISGATGVTNNLGTIYRTVGSLDKALLFYNKSVLLAQKSNDERSLASVYHNICAIYAEQNKMEDALNACNKSYAINLKLNNQVGLVKSQISYGNIYEALNKKQDAENSFLKALALAKSLGFRDDEAAVMLHLGYIYLERKDITQANELFTQGLKIAEELNNRDLQIELTKYLYTVDSLRGDYKMAIFHLNKYYALSDELKKFNPEKKIAELEQKYALTRQENLIKEGEIKKDKSIILYLVIGSVFLLFIGLLIIQHIRFRGRQRITELTQVNLRSQMNPHFIFNILNSLHSFILRNDKESSSNYLVKFARLLRITLDNSQSNLVTINDELEALKLYLELESLRHNHKLEYSFDIDEDIDINMFKIPTLLLQPYVENSIIHGFGEIEGAGKVKIEMRMNKKSIHCSVTDNGMGRKLTLETNQLNNTNHKSYGSKITETRIKLINSLYGKKMSFKYIDLYDDENKPCGTKVEFNLPILN